MKKYKDGGQVPQEIQNALLDRKERMEREAFEKERRKDNEAPKQAIVDALNSFIKKEKKAPKTTDKKAKGGSVSKRADGCAQRGKTKGRMV